MDYKKYTEGDSLSDEELEQLSEELIQAKFDREKRQEWAQQLKDDYGVNRDTQTSKRRFPFSKLAFAAMFIGIVGVLTYIILLFSTPNFNAIVNESIENLSYFDPSADGTRGDETTNAQRVAAQEAYNEKNYEESIRIWTKLLATNNNKDKGLGNYNLGLCYLQKEPSEPKKAITQLLEACKTIPEESNWALALAYIQDDQLQKAKEILQEIVQAKAYKYEKAMELLDGM